MIGYSRAFNELYGPKPIERNNKMNERIRELADEAAKFSAIMALPTGESGDKLFVEKFAELIVQECVDICDRMYFARYPDAEDFERSEEGDAIKQHFGIEQ